MLFAAATSAAVPDGHAGYVAGRYRDGAYSDIWTDVRRCAAATFTAYAPACSCGWRGPAQPITDIAHVACARAWLRGHVAHLPAARRSEHRSVPCAELVTGY
jgi:hypothetical protein